jgi:hypothetical protein
MVGMIDDPKAGVPTWLRAQAERRGLTRALALVPVLSRPALVRAGQSMPSVPTGAVTEPADAFVPDAHRDET